MRIVIAKLICFHLHIYYFRGIRALIINLMKHSVIHLITSSEICVIWEDKVKLFFPVYNVLLRRLNKENFNNL
jgi:hypothetical protein